MNVSDAKGRTTVPAIYRQNTNQRFDSITGKVNMMEYRVDEFTTRDKFFARDTLFILSLSCTCLQRHDLSFFRRKRKKKKKRKIDPS